MELTEHFVVNERDYLDYQVQYADVDESGTHQASFTKEEAQQIGLAQTLWEEAQELIQNRMEKVG